MTLTRERAVQIVQEYLAAQGLSYSNTPPESQDVAPCKLDETGGIISTVRVISVETGDVIPDVFKYDVDEGECWQYVRGHRGVIEKDGPNRKMRRVTGEIRVECIAVHHSEPVDLDMVLSSFGFPPGTWSERVVHTSNPGAKSSWVPRGAEQMFSRVYRYQKKWESCPRVMFKAEDFLRQCRVTPTQFNEALYSIEDTDR